MAEYIERKLLDKAMTAAAANDKDKNRRTWAKAICILHDLPAADVAPVVHGRWIIKHKHRGGFHRYTGIDDMGEQHTITVDERIEYDDRYCSECGKQSADNFLTYCPNCGARMDGDSDAKEN